MQHSYEDRGESTKHLNDEYRQYRHLNDGHEYNERVAFWI
jgi:hypothetical protein